jgi:beta-glucosidase
VVLRVPVRNVGDRAGSDVVQVYASDRTGVVLRPVRELASFAKVHLAPGQQCIAEITIEPRSLQFFDVASGGWRTPTGQVVLQVARSSVEIVAEVTIDVSGDADSSPEPPDTPPVSVTDADFARRLGRAVPVPRPARPFTRNTTLGDLRRTRLGRSVFALLLRNVPMDDETRLDPRHARMVERGLEQMPLRAVAAFSGGRIRLNLIDGLISAMNAARRNPLRRGRSRELQP